MKVEGRCFGRLCADFDGERRLFCRSLFLSLKVAADADPIETAIDPPGENTIAVLEPAGGEQIFVTHA